jgi:hypothetical protein
MAAGTGQWQNFYCLYWKGIDMMKTGMIFVAGHRAYLLTRAGGPGRLTP